MKNYKSISGCVFGIIVFAIGILNLVYVHPVPGLIYILLALIYLPPLNFHFKNKYGVKLYPAVKVVLGVIIIWFTLGVSDLGDMIDKL